MKHEAMTAYETHGSSLEGAKREGHRNIQGQSRLLLGTTLEGGKDMNVHWQIGLLLGATFKRGKDTEMSKEQQSKEEKTPKCPKADRAVVGSNVQKRKGH
jgi:hypothetical protein